MGQIRAPTLVLHGTEDPLFPLGHGEALAREIAGATLVRLEGVGHEYPPRQVWDIVVPAILRHTAAERRACDQKRSARPAPNSLPPARSSPSTRSSSEGRARCSP